MWTWNFSEFFFTTPLFPEKTITWNITIKKKPCVPYVCFVFAYFISYIGFLQVVEERAGQCLERTTFYKGIACQPFQSSFHNLLGGSEGSEQIIWTRPQL